MRQSQPVEMPMPPQDFAAEVQPLLLSEAAAGRFRGAVLLARRGEVLLRSGYGLANEEWQIPNSPTTKFRIGSVTKTFTAAAILKLVEAGTLDLSGGIGTWLANLPEAWLPLTIHQLLTHTAGLRDHLAVPAKKVLNLTGARPVELVELIASEPLLFPPGTSRCYSNTGYILLGMLIEEISHRPYGCFLDEQVLQPLQLAATGYDSHSQIVPERATGYALRDGTLQHSEYLDMSVPFSAGGLFSTLDDLLRWNTALHGGGLITPNSYSRMTAEYPETKKDDGFYGYGLFIGERSGRACLSHSGGVSGFLSMVQYYPEFEGSLILLSNLFDPRALSPLIDRLAEMFVSRLG